METIETTNSVHEAGICLQSPSDVIKDTSEKPMLSHQNCSEGSNSTQASQSNNVGETKANDDSKENSESKIKVVKKKKKRTAPAPIFNCLYTQYDIIKEAAEDLGWKLSFDENDEWDVYWSDLPFGTEKLSKMKNFQKINHFPSMFQICRKNLLAKNLKQMEKMYPVDFKLTPKTWLLPYEFTELKNFVNK